MHWGHIQEGTRWRETKKQKQLAKSCKKTYWPKQQTQTPYLLPNQVKNLNKEIVLSTLYKFAQVHKMLRKLALILLSRLPHSQTPSYFLHAIKSRKNTKVLPFRFICAFYPQELLARLKEYEEPSVGKPS